MSIQVPPDSTGKLVETNSPDGTTERQVITLGDKTATTTATVGAGGLSVNVTNTSVTVRPGDGTNAISALFDLDSGVGTDRQLGVSLRKVASGGSVEAGTSSDPLRTDPTGTTIQPVSGTVATTVADGANVVLGAKADAKSTATDSTAITMMQVLKQISASVQAPPSQAVTNAGTFAVQSTNQANSGVDIGDVTINNAAGAAAVNIQDGGNAITVDGTVATSNLPTTVDTNSGLKSASTLRFVLATDQPALTNKLLVTPDSVALPANQSVNVSQINAVTPLMGNGASGTGAQRVTIANDSTGVIQNIAGATGGASIYHVISAGSTNTANVKASAGTLYGWSIFNVATTPRYVKLHNTAGSPTAGAGVVYTIAVPGSTANGAGSNMDVDVGLAFSTGIGISIVTGIADADTAAVGLSEVAVNLHYK